MRRKRAVELLAEKMRAEHAECRQQPCDSCRKTGLLTPADSLSLAEGAFAQKVNDVIARTRSRDRVAAERQVAVRLLELRRKAAVRARAPMAVSNESLHKVASSQPGDYKENLAAILREVRRKSKRWPQDDRAARLEARTRGPNLRRLSLEEKPFPK